MSKLQTQLGGDPVQALEEAKAAKDLEVITQEEFNAESAKHRGVAMSSLGNDNGPQYGSVGISANGEALPATPPKEGVVHYSTGGAAVGSGTPNFNVSVDPPEAGTSASTDKVFVMHPDDPNAKDPNTLPPQDFVIPTPSKYLRYTNSTGHVVVLGLDEKGIPINKTIFMNDDEVQNMQPHFEAKDTSQ